MKYWWVNHKQTHKEEVEGGYIWSPKAKSNGGHNQTYENLTLVRPGDVIFSYAHKAIKAVGVVTDKHMEWLKPDEFGDAGAGWANVGWKVPVRWNLLIELLEPSQHLDVIAPLLPEKNSPIRANDGNGNQGCYLAAISEELGNVLVTLANVEMSEVDIAVTALSDEAIADQIEAEIKLSDSINSTEKLQLVRARRGQGVFRQSVMQRFESCAVTGVDAPALLIASHIKPWKDCSNQERLDGDNGLLLSPHVDRLFDKGLITFHDDGSVFFSSEKIKQIWNDWGLKQVAQSSFNDKQKSYLTYHRQVVFIKPTS